MTNDFRFSQGQTNKIIASGSSGTSTGAKLVIYPINADEPGTPNQGYIDQTVFATGSVGTDIFLFVSGGIGEKGVGGAQSITAFGGDVHISGNLTIDGTGGGAGGGNSYWTSAINEVILATGSIEHGSGVLASGPHSHAEGSGSISSGVGSHAEGWLTISSGEYSHAEGVGAVGEGGALNYLIAEGSGSHAEGYLTNAAGDYSHAEGHGSYTSLIGISAHAEGAAGAYAYCAHAEGTGEAYGEYSHAEGYISTTYGTYSHSEGIYTTAPGDYAHSEGRFTVASGSYAHAEGQYTIASGSGQHASGKYNKRNNDFSLFVIGDGTGDADASRSDILRVNSGSTAGTGRIEITGSIVATIGISGSHTALSDGTRFLIAGPNIVITTSSNGSIQITGSAAASSPSYWASSVNNKIYTTGSAEVYTSLIVTGSAFVTGSIISAVGFSGSLTKLKDGTTNYLQAGPNITINTASNGSIQITGSAGAISPTYWISNVSAAVFTTGSVDITGSLVSSGSIKALTGFSGSLTKLKDGTSYLISGPNITITTSSNGAIAISASLAGATNYWTSNVSAVVFTTGSIDITGSLVASGSIKALTGFSGSLTKLKDGTSYLLAGPNITITTSSNGSVQISGSAAASAAYWASDLNKSIYTTGSVRIYDNVTITGSFTQGSASVALGVGSFVQGSSSLASGRASHAEGFFTTSSGDYSHAEGFYAEAIGLYSHAEGYGEGLDTQQAVGQFSHTEGFDCIALGDGSHSEGELTYAQGAASHTEGNETISPGLHSHAEGWRTRSSGSASHSEGYGTVTSGAYAHAEGYTVTASGIASHAEGNTTVAGGNYSHVEGYNTYASNAYSHAEGEFTVASGQGSHAEGIHWNGDWGPIATAWGAHAEGDGTKAEGVAAHAEGLATSASGNWSHAEGMWDNLFGPKAIGDGAHAEGDGTIARGVCSHAEGYGSDAVGRNSHAGGYFTIASGSSNGQTVIGRYNSQGNDFSAFIIGDGTSYSTRSDILRVNSGSIGGTGRVEITGSLSVSGSSQTFQAYSGVGYYPKIVPTLPHTLSLGDHIAIVTYANTTADTIYLPNTSVYGTTFIIKDGIGNGSINKIYVVAQSGETIDGIATDEIAINWGSKTYVYCGATLQWQIVSSHLM